MKLALSWKQYGFITRQCIVVGICSCLVLSGMSALVLWYTYQRITVNLCQLVMSSVRTNAAKLETNLRSASHFAEDLAIVMEYGSYTNAELWSLLERQLAVQRTHEQAICGGSIAYLPTGTGAGEMHRMYYLRFCQDKVEKILSGGPDDPYWKSKWFTAARDAGHFIWSEPYFSERGNHSLLMTCSVPFYRTGEDGKRRFAGVVAVDIALQRFRETVQAHRVITQGYSALISLNGSILTHPDSQLSGRRSVFEIAKLYPVVTGIAQEILKGREGTMRVKGTSILNEEVLYFYTPVPETRWMLLSVFPTRLIYERLHALLWMLVVGTVAGAVLMVLLTSLALRNTGKPLQQLTLAASRIGKGDFTAPLPPYPAHDEIGRLNRSLASMQQELQSRLEQLARNISMREKIESELRIAQKIQQTLLPVFLPPLPECREFTLAARLTPARMVSGDLYDIFMIDDHRICMIIGDVSGKGVPAALLMSVIQTFQHCALCKCDDTGKMVSCLNSTVAKNNPNIMFITYFVGIVDLRTGEMQYTNAGHNPPILSRADGSLSELTIVHGVPIGMLHDEQYGFDTVLLNPGDKVFVYTDGITEAENPEEEEFGSERLMQLIRNCGDTCLLSNLLDGVMQEVTAFAAGRELADDMTMWCFQLKKLQNS